MRPARRTAQPRTAPVRRGLVQGPASVSHGRVDAQRTAVVRNARPGLLVSVPVAYPSPENLIGVKPCLKGVSAAKNVLMQNVHDQCKFPFMSVPRLPPAPTQVFHSNGESSGTGAFRPPTKRGGSPQHETVYLFIPPSLVGPSSLTCSTVCLMARRDHLPAPGQSQMH